MQEDRKKKDSPVAVYREMIFGDTCEELELSSIGEIIGITKAADLVDSDEGKMDISIETLAFRVGELRQGGIDWR